MRHAAAALATAIAVVVAAAPAASAGGARPTAGAPIEIAIVDSPFAGAGPTGHGGEVAAVLREALGSHTPARVLSYPDVNRAGVAQPRLMARAIRRAAADGVRLVNVSQAIRGRAPRVRRAIAAAPRTLFVVAAGNEGLDLDALGLDRDPCTVPAPNLICVAATDRGGFRLAPFSNRGERSVDVGASGASPAGDGTSFAAPRVTAAAARLMASRPAWTLAQVRDAAIARFPVP